LAELITLPLSIPLKWDEFADADIAVNGLNLSKETAQRLPASAGE
jgi:hypothetical protein